MRKAGGKLVLRNSGCAAAAVAMSMFASSAFGLGFGYVPGTEGGMAASVPPPGLHYKQYNILVDSDELLDADGDDAVVLGPGAEVDFSARVFAQAHRFVYITEKQILGANRTPRALFFAFTSRVYCIRDYAGQQY